MSAITSGKYDTDHLAVLMTQTGGCCRASNYVGFIRRALDKAGLSHIPVISLNANGMEKEPRLPVYGAPDPGRRPGLGIWGPVHALPVPGPSLRAHPRQRQRPAPVLGEALHRFPHRSPLRPGVSHPLPSDCGGFRRLPIDEALRKPRVGVVGEILVKYMPLANNHLVDLLEQEGAEAIVPDLMDFLNYCVYNAGYKHEFLGGTWRSAKVGDLAVKAIARIRRPAIQALKASRRFDPPLPIAQVAEYAKPFLSVGNQYGEGWFLTGEMVELIHSGRA